MIPSSNRFPCMRVLQCACLQRKQHGRDYYQDGTEIYYKDGVENARRLQ
jgi:hypothetical protein